MDIQDVSKRYANGYFRTRISTEFLVIHHAKAIYKPGKALDSIYSWHKKQWPDYGRIGYNMVVAENVDPARTLIGYLVNPLELEGAHVWGMNKRAFGICFATDFTSVDTPSDKWLHGMVDAIRFARRIYPRAKLVGHTDIALPGHGTACPGTKWHTWRQKLLAMLP